MKKNILFDFDGTIADTIPVIISILRQISGEFGYDYLENIDVEKFKDLKILEILKTLKIPIYKLPFILKRTNDEYKKRVAFVKPFPGIKKLTFHLKKSGFSLGILSSNKVENIKSFLIQNKMDIFDYIYAEKSVFGKAKAMKSFLKKNNLKSENIVYIGDEIRDIEAARKNNIQIIAVSWGFNSKKALQKYAPDDLIDSPEDLLKKIKF